MGTALRVAVCLAWATGLALLTTWSETTSATWAAVAITFLAGAAIGRWWTLLVPVIPAIWMVVTTLAVGTEGDSDGTPAWKWALYIAILAAAIVAVLALGTGVGRLARRGRQRLR